MQAEFGMKQGARIAGFIPVRYPGSEKSDDAAVVRGITTDWASDGGHEYPLGHRLFAFSDESEVPLQHVRQIEFRAD